LRDFPKKRELDFFSGGCDKRLLWTECGSPVSRRLEFQGHSDRIICGSKLLIRKNRTI
jgi:hypothetical protein